VHIRRPSDALEGYVTFFYVVEADGPLTDFLYPEWGNVRFALAGPWRVEMPGFPAPQRQEAVLYGPTDRQGLVTGGGGRTIGFGMTPIGWHRLIDGSAADFANRVAPLGTHLGVDGETLRAQLIGDPDDAARIARLEAVLLARLAARPAVSQQVLAVDRALRMRPMQVGAFADASGIPERSLQRLCLRTFGFAPKRLMRLQRFLDTLGHVRSAVGEAVNGAISEDYFDQAHFYRDFRDFMGMTPRAYFGAPRVLMAKAAEAQVRAGVTLSFRLPPQPG
jgi:AraC-like DNA-binding protein